MFRLNRFSPSFQLLKHSKSISTTTTTTTTTTINSISSFRFCSSSSTKTEIVDDVVDDDYNFDLLERDEDEHEQEKEAKSTFLEKSRELSGMPELLENRFQAAQLAATAESLRLEQEQEKEKETTTTTTTTTTQQQFLDFEGNKLHPKIIASLKTAIMKRFPTTTEKEEEEKQFSNFSPRWYTKPQLVQKGFHVNSNQSKPFLSPNYGKSILLLNVDLFIPEHQQFILNNFPLSTKKNKNNNNNNNNNKPFWLTSSGWKTVQSNSLLNLLTETQRVLHSSSCLFIEKDFALETLKLSLLQKEKEKQNNKDSNLSLSSLDFDEIEDINIKEEVRKMFAVETHNNNKHNNAEKDNSLLFGLIKFEPNLMESFFNENQLS